MFCDPPTLSLPHVVPKARFRRDGGGDVAARALFNGQRIPRFSVRAPMSQFSFLEAEFAEVHALAVQAESTARSDPRAACVFARLALETAVNCLYR